MPIWQRFTGMKLENSLNFDNFYKKGNLMSKNRISSWGGVRKLPFAFTEQRIYMLMTVLKDIPTIAKYPNFRKICDSSKQKRLC